MQLREEFAVLQVAERGQHLVFELDANVPEVDVAR